MDNPNENQNLAQEPEAKPWRARRHRLKLWQRTPAQQTAVTSKA